MATGKLGSADLAATTDTLLFTADVTPQTFNVRFANRNTTSVQIRVAIGIGASPAAADYVDYDVVVPANGILEDTGLVCSSGEKIWVRSSSANVSARAHGL
jgi:hypothetical protein